MVTIYSFDVYLSQFGTSLLLHVWFCCFLTCIQISQEAGKVVWYSHLFKNFPVCCDPYSQRLSIVNEAEVDVLLELSATDVGNLISGSSAFSKYSLNIC